MVSERPAWFWSVLQRDNGFQCDNDFQGVPQRDNDFQGVLQRDNDFQGVLQRDNGFGVFYSVTMVFSDNGFRVFYSVSECGRAFQGVLQRFRVFYSDFCVFEGYSDFCVFEGCSDFCVRLQ